MLNSLNKFGLPLKYAILCTTGAVIGYFLFAALGYPFGGGLATLILASALGGYVGGMIRKRQGKGK